MEYKCGSCREVSLLSPEAKFCPVCGSSSLILVVKEQAEPNQKETVGVYKSATLQPSGEVEIAVLEAVVDPSALGPFNSMDEAIAAVADHKEEEDRPRRKR